MKIRIALLLIFFFVTHFSNAQQYIDFKNVTALQQFLTWKPGQYPLISAHRGGPMPGFPENSLEAMKNSVKYDPMIVEFDVSMSKDSVLILMHDDLLERTTTGKGPVSDHTHEALKQLFLKDQNGAVTTYKIPSLDQVLSWARGKVLMTVDVKRGVPFERVVAAIQRNKAEASAIVITYNVQQAALVHKLNPNLMISVSAAKPEDVVRLNAAGVPNNRMVAFVGTSAPAKEHYQYLQEKGIVSILGTMGNLDNSAKSNLKNQIYYQLVKDGANVLSTKNIELAAEQLRLFRKDNGIKQQIIK